MIKKKSKHLDSLCTFFQKNLLRGIGVEEDLSFVISFGVSLVMTAGDAVGCCCTGGSGTFVICLVAGISCDGRTFASGITLMELTGCSAP